MRCLLHGSFRKHFDAIKKARDTFTRAGIDVLAPGADEVASFENGFAFFSGEETLDPRQIELQYLHHLKRLGENGFSYFVNPGGYIGKSASYELGIAQVTGIPCFFQQPLDDHPAYHHRNSIWKAELLAEYILLNGKLPEPTVGPDEKKIHALWEELMVPGSVVATGGIIEHEKEVLLVRTHKWDNRWSIIGGKVRRNERLRDALLREVHEETGLRGKIGDHLCTFDQIKNSGYYRSGVMHVFVDNIVRVDSRSVRLNEEAEEYVWLPPKKALTDLDIEPNARHTLELYAQRHAIER